MKKLLLVLFLFSTSFLSLALDDQGNPNDPNINERANACYEDGSMAGKCLTDWDWEAGWYLIRFQYGLISREDFPAQFAILLPPLSEEDANKPYVYPTAGCIFVVFETIKGVNLYANFNGGNYIGGLTLYYDTSCTAVENSYGLNLVYAPNGAADALAICQKYGGATILTTIGLPLEPGIYRCL